MASGALAINGVSVSVTGSVILHRGQTNVILDAVHLAAAGFSGAVFDAAGPMSIAVSNLTFTQDGLLSEAIVDARGVFQDDGLWLHVAGEDAAGPVSADLELGAFTVEARGDTFTLSAAGTDVFGNTLALTLTLSPEAP